MSSRVRVYDVARELGLSNKELIELLAEEGLEVRSHSSTIEEDLADLVREHVFTARREQAAREQQDEEPASAAASPVAGMSVARDAAKDDEPEDLAEIHLKPPVVVRDLAEALGRKPNELVGELMTMNVFAAINQVVENDVVAKLCARHGYEFVPTKRGLAAKRRAKAVAAKSASQELAEDLVPRPPVVAFLGHVDHGKTSLLDAIRKTRVTEKESGGITQHIGASVVEWEGHRITLLDTPGHEAFTSMRRRGANATDIVVLVVAADDGVMPQTKEAINHARAAGVPIIVALNKMDLPGAKVDRVLVDLQKNDVAPEEWGGEVGVVRVSATTGEGLEDLLERIILESEMMELRGNPDLPCRGVVVEAQLETGMGPTANVLVRNGTLEVGDTILCGAFSGKVKALVTERGKRVKSAGPSTPVKILGLSGVPDAGEILEGHDDEREAKKIADERMIERRQDELSVTRHASLEDLFRQMEEEARKEITLIVKGDVQGSVEAIIESLEGIESEKISVNAIHSAVGELTENDILLAAASDAIVIGFHVRAMPGVNRLAKQEGVEIRLYSVIYELIEDMKDAMRGRLEPESREVPLGQAEILQIFQTTSSGKVCGCLAQEGSIRVGAHARVTRGGDVIYNGEIVSLRRFQDNVQDVRSGQECGIRLDNFEDFEVGDVIDVSTYEQVAADL